MEDKDMQQNPEAQQTGDNRVKNDPQPQAEEVSVEKMSRRERREHFGKMKEKIAEMEAKALKDKDDYIRLMAEFENFRRRCAKERLELISTASEKIILELLPILDDCERALKALENTTEAQSAVEGTKLLFNKLKSILAAHSVKEIEAMGKDFDTASMEAIAQIPAPEESLKGKVVDVTRKGYMLADKVIRFAQVVVGQ